MTPRPSSTTELVGREEELAVLRARLDQACAGTGGIALVVGEPGIGKTRTAEELAVEARLRGAQVLWGRCYEGEGAPAFWPWVQIIRAYARDHDPATLRDDLGAGAAVLAQIVPELRERLPRLPEPPPLEPAPARFRLFDGVTTFLKTAAERQPLVLVLDDLHWADRPSLRLLQFLARDLRASRLLVLGTYRDAEVGRKHPLAQTLAELAREQISQRILLRGLGEREVARFVELTAGVEAPESLIAAIIQETEGNPFFISEVVRLLLAEGGLERAARDTSWGLAIPQSIREVIGRRIAHLSERSSRVLTIAAVIGREFTLAPLQRVSRLSSEALLEAIEEAEVARVITALPRAPGRYGFSHALIRDVLYEDLPATRRLRLHGEVAEALAAFYGANVDAHLAELAHHFVQAAPIGDPAKAIAYARRAGERAVALLAYEEAISHYERALQTSGLRGAPDTYQECQLHLALGDALRRAGEPHRATATFERAAALAQQIAAPELLVTAALGFEDTVLTAGLARPRTGNPSVRLLEEALRALEAQPSAAMARVLAALARALVFTGSSSRGIALSRQAVELARRVGDPAALVYALNARRIAIWGPDNLEERLAVASEIARLGEEVGDKEVALDGHLWRQYALLECGDVPAADAEIAAYARLADEVRQPLYQCYVPFLWASRALLRGQFAEADLLAEQALALGRRAQSENAVMIHAAQMLVLRREQGRIGEMEVVFADLAERLPRARTFHCALALVCSELGREAEAKRLLEDQVADDVADLARSRAWLLTNVAFLAEVCAFLADARRATTLYRLLLPYATQYVVGASTGPCLGSVARYLGILATTMRCWDEAARHFETALDGHRRIAARPWLARTQFDFASMLLARGGTGDRERAVELLGQALGAARELEMARLVEQALRLVSQQRIPHASAAAPAEIPRRSGDEPKAPSHPDNLTGREVEVLRLLAGGKSNRAIAEELVLSVRTVEHHVASIYAKIGARGRADATAYALTRGLVPARRRAE